MPSPSPEKVLARVQGKPVTGAQVAAVQRLARISGQELSAADALEQAIKEELIRQDAARRGVDVPTAAVDERLAMLVADLGGKGELRRRLRAAGLSEAELRTGIAAVELAERLQNVRFAKLRATSAEARRLYKARPSLFTSPAEVELADLAVRTEAMARDVIGRIRAGQPFASAARQFSADPELRAREGVLGWVVLDSLPPEARAAVAGLRVGQLSQPVLLGNLWHVFKLVDRRPPRVVPFSEVEDGLVAELTRRKRARALARWLSQERADARIVVVVGSSASP